MEEENLQISNQTYNRYSEARKDLDKGINILSFDEIKAKYGRVEHTFTSFSDLKDYIIKR
jgi:hypothetical protein